MPNFKVIIAIHNEEENVVELHKRLSACFQEVIGEVEFWFVDDGSTDDTVVRFKDMIRADSRIHLIKLSRNFGHHKALFAGIKECGDADYFILMDGDLQDCPEDIPQLIAKQKEGNELVYAVRQQRSDSLIKRKTSGLFWRIINMLSDHHIPAHQSVMRLFTRKVRNSLNG